ncbi:MAG: nucleotidyltransferase family protein [Lachnospiraceae bacterium]|nr:nucleotidyltransferase family protein [Lachnospiraceae bacterium]
MKTAGIIAEYNPFHNGHAYQIRQTKKKSGADYIVVVMSPDFVQRGEPALADKYCRTRMALENGADLVLELPVCYACGSAEYFAEGAVSLLHQLGCIDLLSFGCETGHPELFAPLADFFLDESEEYRQLLLKNQRQGMTFPEAREAALLSALAQEPALLRKLWEVRMSEPAYLSESKSESEEYSGAESQLSAVSHLISSPNNILGLEYQKAVRKTGSSMKLFPIRREGSGYHSLDFEQTFCSASAVRQRLLSPAGPPSDNTGSKGSALSAFPFDSWHDLEAFLPAGSLTLLKKWQSTAGFVRFSDFSALLHYKLLSEQEYTRYLDVTSNLSDRIQNLLPGYQNPDQFVTLLKTRQMTETRIRRALLHILLNITAQATEAYRLQGITSYARILGFCKEAAPLLHTMKQTSRIPLITKLADAKKILSSSALQMLTQDIYASHIYQLAITARTGSAVSSEFTHSPIIY